LRVAITGSTGFLGSATTAVFRALGNDVISVRRGSGHAGAVDALGDADELVEQLAGTRALVLIGSADTREDDVAASDMLVAGNVAIPARLMAAAVKAGCPRVVLIGSSWQETRGDGYEPFDLYAATKEAAASVAEHYARHGVDVVQLQMFDTYGPRDVRKKILNLLLDAAVTGQELGMSPGDQHLHLVHVDDAAAAVVLAATGERDDPGGSVVRYRVDSDGSVSLREVVDILVSLGANLHVRFGARHYRDGEIMRPTSRYPRLPGWRPTHSLVDGLRQCLAARRET
jgi:nucleoside-diphosphate-sugar epimerase